MFTSSNLDICTFLPNVGGEVPPPFGVAPLKPYVWMSSEEYVSVPV